MTNKERAQKLVRDYYDSPGMVDVMVEAFLNEAERRGMHRAADICSALAASCPLDHSQFRDAHDDIRKAAEETIDDNH